LRVRYPDGRGKLREILREATTRGFAIDDISTETVSYRQASSGDGTSAEQPTVEVTLHVHGKQSVNDLAAALSELSGVDVAASDVNAIDE
jgi:hypothetical protein